MTRSFPSTKLALGCLRPAGVRRGLLLATSLLAGPLARAQAPSWQSAYLAGGNAYSQVTAMATDASGNVYIAGSFSNATMTLGSLTLTNAVTSGSTVGMSRDAFVAKWSPATQTFVWAQRAGGTTDRDAATALAVSGTSVYVVATLSGTGFGGAAAPLGDYLIKFTDAGAVGWVQPTGLTASALAASGSSVYVAGSFSGTASLGSLSLSSAGGTDLAVAKLTDAGSSGNFVWAQRGGGTGNEYASALALRGTIMYVATNYGAAASFGSTQLVSAGTGVVKLIDGGSSGNFDWVYPVAGTTVSRLAVGSGGRLYAAGSFAGTAAFGATTLTSTGPTSSFIVSLTDGGSTAALGWAQQVGDASGFTNIHSIVASGSSVYLAGQLGGAVSFGTTTLPAPAQTGLYVAKLIDAGSASTYAWAVPATAYFSAFTHSLALSGSNVYLAGMLAGPVTFGSTTLTASGGPVAFLASLADEAALATAPPAALAGLSLVPNPAHGTALVQVPAVPGTALATLTLLDAVGRVARTRHAATGAAYPLDLAGLAPGVYMVQVQAGAALATQRLLVE